MDSLTPIMQPKCTVCGKPIPADHPKPKTALTCSDECRDIRVEWRRQKENAVRCRHCFKPSTPAERSRFRRWRNFEKKNPPPIEELAPEEVAELEYRKANPPKKRGPKPKVKQEETDGGSAASSDME